MPLTKYLSPLLPNAKPVYIQSLDSSLPLFRKYELHTPLRLSHFFAQIIHESAGLLAIRENLSYSKQRIVNVFGAGKHSAAITPAEAKLLEYNSRKLAERVYGLGNPQKAKELGNIMREDGYTFRGNGLIQITGRGMHQKMGNLCDLDLEGNPDLVTSAEHCWHIPLAYWNSRALNQFADNDDISTITRKINGGYTGLKDRLVWFNKVFAKLSKQTDFLD